MNVKFVREACLSALVAGFCVPAMAEGAPTFHKDVLPILQESCQICHRDSGANFGGMYAPMAFTDYRSVRPWAKAIAKNVSDRTMPPWDADPMHDGEFENERTISQEAIDTLVSWVEGGAKRGNPAEGPEPKIWPATDGWQIGEPDFVIRMNEPFLVEDDVEDLYQSFYTLITEDMLSEPRWLKASETRPGSGAVHHIVAYPLGGLVPGGDPKVMPEGVSTLLMPGTQVYWSLHYHKEAGPGTAVWDQSEIAVKLYPKDAKITHIQRGAGLANWTFKIPAGHPAYPVYAETTLKEDVLLLNYMPHMHLRGSAAKFEAFYPDGTNEVLLNIPNYDFNWQTTYQYKEPKFIPGGTRIKLTSVFDNSADNPSNPDPTIDVVFGEPTTSEMVKSPIEFIRAVEQDDIEAYVANMISRGASKDKGGGKKKGTAKGGKLLDKKSAAKSK
jgi:hypothetical protein